MRFFHRTSAEPLWRDEFSVHAADERYVTRRQFTKFLVLTSLGMFVGNAWILVRSLLRKNARFPRQLVAQMDQIPVGGVKLFTYPTPEDHCILVRTAEDNFVAYSQKCTHLSCAVYYARDSGRLNCPCHEGVFSVRDGAVLAGPPRRPLPRVVLEKSEGDLVAVAMETGERQA